MAVVPNYNALPDFVSFSDLLNHAAAFAVLFTLLERAYPGLNTYERSVFLSGYAVAIEIVQYFLPLRFASFSDIAADCIGIIAAIALVSVLKKLPFCRFCYQK